MSNIKFLSIEQSERLVNVVKIQRHKVIILLMLDCGLRVSEVINLKFKNFDFKNKLLIVESLKKRTSEKRKIPLSNRLYQELAILFSNKSNINGSDFLFPSKINKGKSITRDSVNKFMKSLNNKLGYDFLHPHCLRHTFGTNHISNGTPLENIKIMLGHSKYDTTLIYSQIPTEILKANIKKVTDKKQNALSKLLNKLGISFKKEEKKININFYKDNFSIGRISEFKKLENNAEKGINTLIIGNIGLGKSHLLENFNTDKKILRLDDLSGIKTSLINMLIYLYNNDKLHIKTMLYSDLDLNKLKTKFSRTSIRNLTKEICDAVKPKEYLLVIDNVDRISPKGVEMIELLKDHFIIFTSARNVKIDRSSFTWNFDRIDLKEFNRTTSFELINKLSYDIEVEDKSLFRNHIYEQSNGNPRVIFEIIDRYRREPVITNEVVKKIRHTASLKEIDLTFVVFLAFGLMYLLRYMSKEVDNDSYKFIGGIALVATLIFRQLFGFTKRKFL